MSQPARASTPLSSLRVTTPSMVVSLSRNGIVTIHDLLTRPLDEVAYLLDSYDEAEALIIAGQEFMEGRGRDSRPADACPTGRPVTKETRTPTPAPPPPRAPAARTEPRQEKPAAAPARPVRTPRRPQPPAAKPAPVHAAGPTKSASRGRKPDMPDTTTRFADAVALAMDFSGPVSGSMSEKAHRLTTAATVLAYSEEEDQAIAGVLVEPIHLLDLEPLDRASIRERYGDSAADLLEEVDAIMSVPMSPSGRPSPAYKGTVEKASEGAIIVAGAHALTAARAVTARSRTEGETAWEVFQGGRAFAAWYFKTLADGVGASLRQLDHNDLAIELNSAVDELLEEAEGADTEGRKAA